MTQSALCLSRGSAERHIRQIAHCVAGIIFLGTPHHGSDLAAWGKLGTNIARIAQQPNSCLVAVLKPGSETLASVQNSFHNLLRLRKNEGTEIDITCFYEELAFPVIGMVKCSNPDF